MALATAADVEARLGRELTATESAKAAPGLLDEASDLVDTYLGWDGVLPDPVPAKVARVVARMVARVLEQPGDQPLPLGVTQATQTMGPFSESATFEAGATSRSPWLSSTDKQTLRRLRVGGGLSTVSFSTSQTGGYRSEAY